MNILFLMGQYPSVGGVEKVSTVLANEFVRRGHQVDIVSFEQPNPEIARQELDKSVMLHALSFPVSKRENRNMLQEIIRARKIDFIISQWAVPFYVARLCRRAIKGTNCKLITVHHNLPDTNARIKSIEIYIENRKGNRFVNLLKLAAVRTVSRLNLRGVYHLSDRYIVLSESFKKIARKYMWLRTTRKMLAISNPVTTNTATPSLQICKENEIIYVGRIEYNQKRNYRIVDIWEKVKDKFPEWKLTIIGDGPDKDDLAERIRTRNLDRIKIVGFQNPIHYYQKAALILLVSEYEGLPLVLAEAMTFGCIPVILATFPAIHDIIDGTNGVKVNPPYNRELMAEALMSLMSNQKKRVEYGKAAIESVSKFNLDSIANQWEQLFHCLAANIQQ